MILQYMASNIDEAQSMFNMHRRRLGFGLTKKIRLFLCLRSEWDFFLLRRGHPSQRADSTVYLYIIKKKGQFRGLVTLIFTCHIIL